MQNWLKLVVYKPLTENDGRLINKLYNNRQVYKKRIGNIRILFVIYEKEIKILVTEVKNRGQVYKKNR